MLQISSASRTHSKNGTKYKELVVFCVFFLLSITCLTGNATIRYYKQIKIVTKNGQQQQGDNRGQFITFTDNGCYDSDKWGYDVKNGFLKYKGNANGYNTYYGSSFWGTATYYFKNDYSRLNIVVEATDITYVYELATPPANAETCALIKESKPNSVNPITPANPVVVNSNNTLPTPPPTSTSSKDITCKSCNGTGKCTMCHGSPKKTCTYCDGRGKKIYGSGSNVEYSRCAPCNGIGYTLCPGCNASGNCGICHGSGKIR
jgi:hypothetical protein